MKILKTLTALGLIAAANIALAQQPIVVGAVINCDNDANGEPLLQDAVNTAPAGTAIVVSGVCSNQGRVIIDKNDLLILGSPTALVEDVDFVIDGADGVTFSNVTLRNDNAVDPIVTVGGFGEVILSRTNIMATGEGRIIGVRLNTGRAVVVGSEITVLSLDANAQAISANGNSAIALTSQPSFISATAAGVATGVEALIGSTLTFISGDTFFAQGGESSLAFNLSFGSQALQVESVGESAPATILGDALVVDSGLFLREFTQSGGELNIVDGKLRLNASSTNAPENISLRTSVLTVSAADLNVNVDASLGSTVTIRDGSTVMGTVTARSDSRIGLLDESSLENAVVDKPKQDVFVEDGSYIANIQKAKKNK